MLDYSKYPLSRVIDVYQIVSADLVNGYLFADIHMHQDALELVYCIDGSCMVLRDRVQIPLGKGDVVIVTPGTMHTVSSQTADSQLFAVSFCCESEYLQILHNARFRATDSQKELFSLIMKELRSAFELSHGQLRLLRFQPSSTSPVGAEQLICCYLEQIMISFLREVTSENGRVVESRYFDRAIRQYMTEQIGSYVQDHLSEKLTVEDLAKKFHYSRSRLSTLYKSTTGIGLNEFITREMIEAAKKMLLSGDLSGTQVSDRLGFSSPEYFSRRFRQCAGMTPTDFAASGTPGHS